MKNISFVSGESRITEPSLRYVCIRIIEVLCRPIGGVHVDGDAGLVTQLSTSVGKVMKRIRDRKHQS